MSHDYEAPENRYRCTSCGELCSDRKDLIEHYMRCWKWIPMSRRRLEIAKHLKQWTYDIFGGTKFSVAKGRVPITEREKDGDLARYYRMFNPKARKHPKAGR